MGGRFPVVMIAAIALGAASPARADRVPSPPEDCPPGSRGHSSHTGRWCASQPCADDSACGHGLSCRPSALCIEDQPFVPHSRRPPPGEDPTPQTRAVAVAPCGADGSCPGEARCVRAERCVPGPAEPTPPPPSKTPSPAPASSSAASDADGGGCAVARPGSGGGGWLALALALCLAARRPAQRPPGCAARRRTQRAT